MNESNERCRATEYRGWEAPSFLGVACWLPSLAIHFLHHADNGGAKKDPVCRCWKLIRTHNLCLMCFLSFLFITSF